MTDLATTQDAIAARGLGLRAGGECVFRRVDFRLPAHGVGAIVGPAGSGRSSLLLALVGRMRVTTGELVVAGIDGIARPAAVRGATAVARLADVVALEDELTVAETVTERSLIDGVRPRAGRAAFEAACESAGVSFDPGATVGHLPARDRALLALLVTAVRPAKVVVIDDTDAGATDADEREIYRVATAFAAIGPAIVTVTTRRESLPETVRVLDLTDTHDGPAPSDSAPSGAAEVATDDDTAPAAGDLASGDEATEVVRDAPVAVGDEGLRADDAPAAATSGAAAGDEAEPGPGSDAIPGRRDETDGAAPEVANDHVNNETEETR